MAGDSDDHDEAEWDFNRRMADVQGLVHQALHEKDRALLEKKRLEARASRGLLRELAKKYEDVLEDDAQLRQRNQDIRTSYYELKAEVQRQKEVIQDLTTQNLRLEKWLAETKAESRAAKVQMKTARNSLALENRELRDKVAELEKEMRRLNREVGVEKTKVVTLMTGGCQMPLDAAARRSRPSSASVARGRR